MIRRERIAGETVDLGAMTITPEYEAIGLAAPGARALYQRPTAIRVERDATVEWLTVPDVTRQGQILLYAGAALCGLAALLVSGARGRTR